jgi:hypothetical protein
MPAHIGKNILTDYRLLIFTVTVFTVTVFFNSGIGCVGAGFQLQFLPGNQRWHVQPQIRWPRLSVPGVGYPHLSHHRSQDKHLD